jgi:Tol biopolymer transport system component/DNA-binding winged helix-turn-helix (wHTH) protein
MDRNSQHLFEFGPFTLDTAERRLTRNGQRIPLTPKVFETLVALIEHRGRLVEKERLMKLVWPDSFVEEANLTNNISTLRRALSEGEGGAIYIETIPRIGYRFSAPVRELPRMVTELVVERHSLTRIETEEHEEVIPSQKVTTASAPVEEVVPTSVAASHSQKRTALITAALIVFGAVGVIGFYWIISQRLTGNRATTPPFATMGVSRLTTSGTVTHAAISPDGKYVANIVRDSQGNSLWVKHVGAPSNVRIAGPALTEYISVTFAPNGNSIYYIALDHDKGESTLYRVPALGGQSDIVANDVYPIGFSPDGQRIAFIRFRRSESHLVVADANGANQHNLATRQKPDAFELEWNAPAWSPDGKTIACPARLNDKKGHYGAIVGINTADGTQTALTSMRWNYVGQPVWLADGGGLLLTASDRPGAPMAIWHVSLPSGEATRITRDLNNYSDLTITDDMSQLVAVQVQSVSNVWVAPQADARGAKQIKSETGSLESLAWTRDGRIVYRSSAGGNGADIWIMNADGSNARQLTVGARVGRGLAVTPDSNHVIFSSDSAGQFNLWRVDTDGGNLRQLTSGDGEFYPQCTPDGRWVVYQVNEVIDPRLWKVPIDGGQPVQLLNTRATRPAVSPDGQMIAYSYLDTDLNPSRWGIGLVSVEGGQRLRRFDFPPTVTYRQVRWSPDGRSIGFINSPSGLWDIWLQPLDGNAPKPLTNFQAEQIIAFDWSRDGHWLAFVREIETRDVVLIEQQQK